MTTSIRPAGPNDIEQMADLLLADAEARCRADPLLWKLDDSPREKILSAVQTSIEAGQERWLLAQVGDAIVGLTHAMIVPVPPIYDGKFGAPGLLMEDCFVSPDAPLPTRSDLLQATEADLVKAGAQMVIASSAAGGDWEDEYAQSGYEPVTLYFSKTGLSCGSMFPNVRSAREGDVADIVAASAVHREILERLNPTFWRIHAEANDRFAGWMTYSLTLSDRDMFVSEADEQVRGYAISQPATRLHFPRPHDISAIGVIDDYFHESISPPESPSSRRTDGRALLEAAEAARHNRGNNTVLVVCPAAWRSKISLLEDAGYSKAITWSFKVFG